MALLVRMEVSTLLVAVAVVMSAVLAAVAGRLEAVLGDLGDGARVTLVYSRRGERLTTQLTVEADPRLELVSAEQLGRRPTPAQQRFRDEWLGSKAGL